VTGLRGRKRKQGSTLHPEGVVNPFTPIRFLLPFLMPVWAGPALALPHFAADARYCTDFYWSGSREKPDAKAGLFVKTEINGQKALFQIDTGSDATILRGRVSDEKGWSRPGEPRFATRTFSVGPLLWPGLTLGIDRTLYAPPGLITGTIGTDILAGHLLVLDFPDRRLCLYPKNGLPPGHAPIAWQAASFRNGWFMIAGQLGDMTTASLVFDSGSSLFDLIVGGDAWQRLTSRPAVKDATITLQAVTWGTPVTIYGAPATASIVLGGVRLKPGMVYTVPAMPPPEKMRGHPDGIVGNAPFLDKILLFDMTAHPRFAVLAD
jgi:hypothetical protein